ncbi:hypothetical protein Misp06_00251 [Microbulbifer sp. NBRC 101763]|uniref:efflux RND transporter periplasmic adaptor subunit n=1 Tax=Microbulbifer sp. NBRC 101763 TaxID=1113820 RepID=UPI0030B03385
MKKTIKVAAVMVSLSFSTVLYQSQCYASDLQKVRIQPAQEWLQATRSIIYCTVNSPPLTQISSHAEAELKSAKPVGSIVKAGELVAEQDGFYLSRGMDILKTDLEIAERQLSHAEEELARLMPLREAQMVSPSQLNDLKLNASTFRLSKQRLKQQLEIDQYRFERLKHFASRDSQVLQVEAHPGERLTRGQRILQLLPLNEKQLECLVPRDQIGMNLAIQKNEFRYDGEPLSLKNIGRTMDGDTQNLSLYFDGHGKHFESLLVGQRFQIAMLSPTGPREKAGNITKLPSDAVLLEGGKYHTWALGLENKVRKVEVEILDTLADHFIVISEIQPGDQLVVLGNGNLQADQEVVPVDRDS